MQNSLSGAMDDLRRSSWLLSKSKIDHTENISEWSQFALRDICIPVHVLTNSQKTINHHDNDSCF